MNPSLGMYGQRRQRGVTLIELLVALAVLAILVAMAAPSFRELATNNRSSGIVNGLLADLAMARSEATKQARAVSVRATGANWDTGWRLFVDQNGDGNQGADDVELKTAGDLNEAFGPANAFALTANTAVITYGPMGQLLRPASAAEFALCRPDDDAEKSVGIRVDLSGRAQSFKGVGAC